MTGNFPVPGEEFESSYRIEAILGSGGFARVYRAVEHGLDRQVALKILRPPTNSAQSDSERDSYLITLMKRFEREARMLSQLRSPHTIGLYKYGKTDNGLLYMALEYVDGLSLAEVLRAGEPIEPQRVVTILRQVLLSLHEAHSMNMLHRDLKPANIMVYDHLGARDQVKLLDFGIAKVLTEADNSKDLTSDGTLIGTPRYMAPEQIQGQETGPPADIYALGFVAYELLTGQRAIKDDSSINIIGKQLAPDSFKLPQDCDVPSGLRALVDRMIEKRLDLRYTSTSDILADLDSPTLLDADLPEVFVERLDVEDQADDDSLDVALAPAPSRNRWRYLLPVLLLGALALAYVTVGDDAAVLPEVEKVAAQQPPAEPPEPEPTADEPALAEVQVTARLDGQPLYGATILIGGVDKGVTPLTLPANEIADVNLQLRYSVPDFDQVVETTLAIDAPRDVTFELDELVDALEPLEEVEAPQPTTPTKVSTSKRRPPVKKKKPETPPSRPAPEPKAKPTSVYVAPE